MSSEELLGQRDVSFVPHGAGLPHYGLPVDAVKEAIAYCESNPPEILEDYAREEALMEATGMNDPTYKWDPKPKLLSPQERVRLES